MCRPQARNVFLAAALAAPWLRAKLERAVAVFNSDDRRLAGAYSETPSGAGAIAEAHDFPDETGGVFHMQLGNVTASARNDVSEDSM